MLNNSAPSKDDFETIIAFKKVFEKPTDDLLRWTTPGGEFPYVEYSADIYQFFINAEKLHFMKQFEWGNWMNEQNEYLEHPEKLVDANLDIISKLLWFHYRGERFCEGHIGKMISNGHLLAIINRLEKIKEELYG